MTEGEIIRQEAQIEGMLNVLAGQISPEKLKQCGKQWRKELKRKIRAMTKVSGVAGPEERCLEAAEVER